MLFPLLTACSSFNDPPATSSARDGSIRGFVLTETYLETGGVAPQGGMFGDGGFSAQNGLSVASADGQPGYAQAAQSDSTGNADVEVRRADDPRGEVSTLGGVRSARGARYAPDRVLVEYRSGADASEPDGGLSSLSDGGKGSSDAPQAVDVKPGESVEAALARLARDPDVESVSPDYYVYPTGSRSDFDAAGSSGDPLLSSQWGLSAAGVPLGVLLASDYDRPVVAVIDTGFDLSHEDLDGRFLPGYDFCADADCSTTDSDPSNGDAVNWHGTHVASIVAAVGGNGLGLRGVADGADVRILPVKVFSDGGWGGSTSLLIKGLRWAAGLPVEGAPINANPARVINLSLAGDFHSDSLQATLDEVRAAGTLVVASTGNHGLDRVMSPAAADGVLGVGAINSDFGRACFSNYGVGVNGPGGVDLVAAGGENEGSSVSCGISAEEVQGVVGAFPGDQYGAAVGTSMAAPAVAGVAALLLAAEPELTVEQLEERLGATAYFNSEYMTADAFGFGVLRADRALGFPGPGDSVRVELESEEFGDARSSTVAIGLDWSASSFSFAEVPAGNYELRAELVESGRSVGQLDVILHDGQELRANLVVGAGY